MEIFSIQFLLMLSGAFAVAALIGATAIGGLLLVPVMTLIGDIPLQIAIPACLFTIFFSGLVGSYIFGRNGLVNLNDFTIIALPAGLAALGGVAILPQLPTFGIEIFIACLCLFGFMSSLPSRRQKTFLKEPELSAIKLIVIGSVVGFGSAVSGTGGPLLLIPILMSSGFETKRAIGLAQVIQIPIGGFAAIGNLSMGTIDFELTLPLLITVVFGSATGALAAQKTSPAFFRPIVSSLMLLAGVLYISRAL